MPRLGVKPGPQRTNKGSHLMWLWQCFTWKVAIRRETHSRAVGRVGWAGTLSGSPGLGTTHFESLGS